MVTFLYNNTVCPRSGLFPLQTVSVYLEKKRRIAVQWHHEGFPLIFRVDLEFNPEWQASSTLFTTTTNKEPKDSS